MRRKNRSLRPNIRFLQVRNSGGLSWQGAEDVVRSGQILARYFVGRFAERLDVVREIQRRVKKDLKSFNLEGWSFL